MRLTRHPATRRTDPWVAAAFVLASAVEAVVRYHDQPVQLAINLPGAAVWAILGLRRTRPLLTLSVIAASGVVGSLLQAWLTPTALTNSDVAVIALLVATYSLGVHGSRRQLVLGAPLPALLIVAVDLLQPGDQPLETAVPFAVFFVVIAPVVGGRLVRGRAALVATLRAQDAELEANRGAQLAAELARDRLAISERLHGDLVQGVRELGLLVRRAANGQDGQGAEPTGDAEVGEIERSARELLAHTRQVVVSLTDGNAADGAALSAPTARREGWGARARARARTRLRAQAQPWTVLAAAALAGGLVLELPRLSRHAPLPVAVPACVVLVLPLALVWLRPLLLTAVLWVGAALFDRWVATLSTSTAAIGLVFVAPFAVAALATRWTALAGLALCGAGAALVFRGDGLGGALLLSVLSWLAGLGLRAWSRLAEQLRANAVLLAEQRATATQGAVMRDRARLARDLHDAIGHHLTIVALQAGAARRLWRSEPDRAAAALRTIGQVVDGGLAELESSWGPMGATGSFAELLAGSRRAGLQVDAELDGIELDGAGLDGAGLDGAGLDGAGLDGADRKAVEVGGMVIYRVLQESLTNILRHAPGATATVALHQVGDHLELTVANTAGTTRPEPDRPGSGRGLTGMRARVAACGGRLDWHRRRDGGFVVRAEVPLAGVASGQVGIAPGQPEVTT